MMKYTKSFGTYAKYYDLFYSDLKYQSEFKQLKNLIPGNQQNLCVEIGCGTGRFTTLLSNHFYQVLALDSSVEMINIASSRLAKNPNVSLFSEEMKFFFSNKFMQYLTNFKLKYPEGKLFIFALFHVINYLKEDELRCLNEVIQTVRAQNIEIHLFFDIWDLEIVRLHPPKKSTKFLEGKDINICRIITPSLNSKNEFIELDVEVVDMNSNTRLVSEYHLIWLYSIHDLSTIFGIDFNASKSWTLDHDPKAKGIYGRYFHLVF